MSPPQLPGRVMTDVTAVRRAPIRRGAPAEACERPGRRWSGSWRRRWSRRAAVPSRRRHDASQLAAEPLPIVTPGRSGLRRSPGTPSSPSSSAEPSAAGSTSRRGNWPASSGRLSGTRRASQRVGPGTETPAAVTAATARTPLQITCLRRGSAPPRLQQRHPKQGL